jgi:DNA-binding NarL/FixJ family response regulator
MMETVLIVDDHAGFRAYAREMLESEGFRVVGEAPDAASAITAAQQLQPDIVLLDVHLPDLDGFRASKRIAAANGAPAIVLTSSGDVGDLAATVAECPARGFIPKAELSSAAIRALVTAST